MHHSDSVTYKQSYCIISCTNYIIVIGLLLSLSDKEYVGLLTVQDHLIQMVTICISRHIKTILNYSHKFPPCFPRFLSFSPGETGKNFREVPPNQPCSKCTQPLPFVTLNSRQFFKILPILRLEIYPISSLFAKNLPKTTRNSHKTSIFARKLLSYPKLFCTKVRVLCFRNQIKISFIQSQQIFGTKST